MEGTHISEGCRVTSQLGIHFLVLLLFFNEQSQRKLFGAGASCSKKEYQRADMRGGPLYGANFSPFCLAVGFQVGTTNPCALSRRWGKKGSSVSE